MADLKAGLYIIIDTEPQPTDQDCLYILEEDTQVEILFHFEIISAPNVLFPVLLDYLVLKEILYLGPSSIKKLSHGYSNTFLEAEDKIYAYKQPTYLRLGSEPCKREPVGKYQPSQPVIMSQAANHEDKNWKTANG